MAPRALALLAVFALICSVSGDRTPDVQVPSATESTTTTTSSSSSPWGYAVGGADWWVGACAAGAAQSPINLPSPAGVPASALITRAARVQLGALGALPSNGSNVQLQRDGAKGALRASWPAADAAAAGAVIGVPVLAGARDLRDCAAHRGGGAATAEPLSFVNATAVELLLHTPSEHLLQGRSLPLETQLVARVSAADLPGCPPEGCAVAVSTLWELAPGDEAVTDAATNDTSGAGALLDALLAALPAAGQDAAFAAANATLNLGALTTTAGNGSYLAYLGSLTAPPCTEGALWVVMAAPQQLRPSQWQRLVQAVGGCSGSAISAVSVAANASAPAAAPDAAPIVAATGNATAANGTSNATVVAAAPVPPAPTQAPPAASPPAPAAVPAASATAAPPASAPAAAAAPTPAATASPAAAAAAPSTRRRALLQQAAATTVTPPPVRFQCSAALGAHGNARLPQLLNGRVVAAFIDAPPPPPPTTTTATTALLNDIIPADKARALAAGAIAGIVVGVLGGVGLTAGVAALAYRQSKRRRIKKLSLGWADERSGGLAGAGPWAAREVESQFLKSELGDNI